MGRSAVAASAYMSCSKVYNDYDGIQHDYTRKRGLVWQRIFLPAMAPDMWQDREALWNAIEETEKSKDSRLAREFNVALPTELSEQENVALLKDYLQTYFVAEGMCVDVSIHDTDSHNPHAHIFSRCVRSTWMDHGNTKHRRNTCAFAVTRSKASLLRSTRPHRMKVGRSNISTWLARRKPT